jgi:hypothetical protein
VAELGRCQGDGKSGRQDPFPAAGRQQRVAAGDWLRCRPNSWARAEIRDPGCPDRDHAEQDIEAFARDYGVTWPRSVAKIIDEAKALLCFCDFPAEHLLHLRTSNPIRSN